MRYEILKFENIRNLRLDNGYTQKQIAEIPENIDEGKFGLFSIEEIQSGKKKTHWMWYIFPQIDGLGTSSTSKYYGIKNIEEAKAYIDYDYLYNHLIEICIELLKLNTNNIITTKIKANQNCGR